jgi:ATP-dependent DNA helicase RecG
MNAQIHLETSVRYLKGVGPERAKVLARLGLETLGDLFYFFPRRYENRSPIKPLNELSLDEKACVEGIVTSRGLIRTKYGQSIFKVVISDGKGTLFASWFNQPYLNKVFLPKSKVVFYGKVEKKGAHFQMIHPDYEIVPVSEEHEKIHFDRIVPVYPLTEDLGQKALRQFLFTVIREFLSLMRDPLPAVFRRRLKLADSVFAFRNIHFPESRQNWLAAYRRLVFDEFLMMQTVVWMRKIKMQRQARALSHGQGREEVRRLVDSLGFELTQGQRNAISDILADMEKSSPMNRLVQGDVGSGKTVVAAAALTFTAANGFQGALMAPTEVLAQQLYFNLTQMLEPLGITCGYLAQGIFPEEKKRALAGAALGEIQVLVGTHALIQERVDFKNLGLVVIDEQHKFGVFQRAALKQKGGGFPHFLLMTATPIPRTLALTLYGDLDVSTIAERPKDRKPIKTFWVEESRRQEIYGFLDACVSMGRQGYVICPWIDERSEVSVKSALTAHAELSKVFSHHAVGILHGRMKSLEKKKVMQDFKDKKIQILVSTVVIEVGVDVPNASVMIIENAEKFGLAQLHQLRGRVGRGTEESFCILFSTAIADESAERLRAFEETESGFDIAEKDLGLRGAGDIVGQKQHGFPRLRIGDLAKDIRILQEARFEAKTIVEKDPDLALPENRLLKKAIEQRFETADEKLAVLA